MFYCSAEMQRMAQGMDDRPFFTCFWLRYSSPKDPSERREDVYQRLREVQRKLLYLYFTGFRVKKKLVVMETRRRADEAVMYLLVLDKPSPAAESCIIVL